MTLLRLALLMGAVLASTSCATGYGAKGLTGGYSDLKIDETHYRVKFDGNGYASKDRVWGFWMYRCAELTREKGYAYFSIQRPGETVGRAQPAPGIRSAAYVEEAGAGRFVQTRSGGYSYVPIYVPGGTSTSWHSDAVVAMFKDPLPEDVWVLRADLVLEQLSAYVKANGEGVKVDREDVFRRSATIKLSERGYRFGGPL
jgi:hypothetical protein